MLYLLRKWDSIKMYETITKLHLIEYKCLRWVSQRMLRNSVFVHMLWFEKGWHCHQKKYTCIFCCPASLSLSSFYKALCSWVRDLLQVRPNWSKRK